MSSDVLPPVIRLSVALAQFFSLEELAELCRAVRLRPEDISGSDRGAQAWATEIARTAAARKLLQPLLIACAARNPRGPWMVLSTLQLSPAVDTGGGAHIARDVHTQEFVGRDKITVISDERSYDVGGLENPYLGLRAFRYDDRDKFAGREQLVAQEAARITQPDAALPLVFVTGASGSGKSSFAQAGLIPALEAHYLGRGMGVKRATARLSNRPREALIDALQQLGLVVRPGAPLAELFAQLPPSTAHLLVIDQFEECFAPVNAGKRDWVLDCLAATATQRPPHVHVIVTMRSDYLGELDLARHAELTELALKQGIHLHAMCDVELRDAIQKPLQDAQKTDSRFAGKRFEAALLDDLARDAAADATFLPLLGVTLRDLWQRGSLRQNSYKGLTDAIKQRAETVYTYSDYDNAQPVVRRPDAEQREMLALMLELVNVSLDDKARRDVRQAMPREQLTGGSALRQRLIEDLSAKARLLSVSDDAQQVDLIHESLIAKWDRLREAVRIGRRELQRRTRFGVSFGRWRESGRDPQLLLAGLDLAEAQALKESRSAVFNDPRALLFFEASLAKDRRKQDEELAKARQLADEQTKRAEAEHHGRRRARVLGAVAGVVALLAIGLSVAAFLQRSEAERQRKTAQSGQMASIASRLTSGLSPEAQARGEMDTALLLAVESERINPGSDEARNALMAATQCCPEQLESFLRGHSGRVWSVAFDPSGRILATASEDGKINLWDVQTRSLINALVLDPYIGYYTISFSHDGSLLLAGDTRGRVSLIDTRTWNRIALLNVAPKAIVTSLAISANDARFVAGGADGRVSLWDLKTHREITATQYGRWVWDVAFDQTGTTVASATRDAKVLLWMPDVAGGLTSTLVLTEHQPLSSAQSVVFGERNGVPLMATGGFGGNVILWDMSPWLTAREKPVILSKATTGVNTNNINSVIWGLEFSSDGEILAAGSGVGAGFGQVKAWRVTDAVSPSLKAITPNYTAHPHQVLRIAFQPKSTMLAAGSIDGLVSLWNFERPHSANPVDAALAAVYDVNRMRAVTVMTTVVTGTLEMRTELQASKSVSAALQIPNAYTSTLARLSPDGTTVVFATSFGDHRLYAQGVSVGQALTVAASKHVTGVSSIAYSPDGQLVASGDEAGSLYLWRLPDLNLVAQADGAHRGRITALAFSPDGNHLISGGCSVMAAQPGLSAPSCNGIELQQWAIQPLQKIQQLESSDSFDSATSLGYCPNGRILVVGSTGGALRVIDMETRKTVFYTKDHPAAVTALACSGDGTLLASGDRQGNLLFWSLTTKQRLGREVAESDKAILSLTFTPDTTRIVVIDAGAITMERNISIDRMVNRACAIANRNLTQAEWRRYFEDEPYRITCPAYPAGT